MPAISRERWLVLEPLLDQALDLSAADRAAWLDELRQTASDTADEISALLSGEGAMTERGFLATPPSPPPSPALAGLEVGPYRLERPLGQGGMGSVWLAHRVDGRFEGQVAVKLLNHSLLTPHGQERFRREGSMLARLTHPGIARLLDAGVRSQGQPYLVLEHVDGERIDAYVQSHALTGNDCVRLLLQVLDAVGHAHASLIVHRDIKPSNILVTRDGVAKLLDFGIAKLLGAWGEAEDAGEAALTVDGGRPLTPEYAAPEQVRGETITTATDVYSAGVLLYVLLSGRHPTLPAGAAAPAALHGRFDREPPRLGLGDLDNILQKALKSAVAERYQSVATMADDLSRYLRHEPISARPDSPGYRLRRFVRRNRLTVTSGAVVAASLLGAAVFSARQMRETERERDAAVTARARADAQRDFQALLMSEVGDRPVTLRELLDRASVVVERGSGVDDRAVVPILVDLAAAYLGVGDVDPRETLLRRASTLALKTGQIARLAEVRCQQGDVARIQGDMDRARHLMDQGDSLLRAAPDPGADLSCLGWRVQLEAEAGNEPALTRAVQRALVMLEGMGKVRTHEYAELLAQLADAEGQHGQVRQGVHTFRRAIALLDTTGWGRTTTGLYIRHNAAVSIGELGETALAYQMLLEVIRRGRQGDTASPVPVQALIHFGQMALDQHQHDSAAKYFAILVRQATADSNPYWETRGAFGLAQAQMHRGDLAEARRTMARFRSARAKVKRLSTDDQIASADVLEGELALLTGYPDSALTLLRRGLQANGYPDKRSRRFHTALLLAARSALATHAPDAALEYARVAERTATIDSLTVTGSTYVGEARLSQGKAHLALGDSVAARAAFASAAVALRSGAGADHPNTREATQLRGRIER